MPDLDLDTLILLKGSHDTREQGVCLLEAAAWLAGRDHTDHPPCVSPVLGAFGRPLNDALPDDARQQLKPYVRPMLGTADDGKDERRSYLALDWLIRTWLPAWLDLAGLDGQALRDLAPVTDLAATRAAGPVVRAARDGAAAAWAAAGDAAGAAAGDAAWDAAGDAAGDAAWAAAGDAAGAAAWAAARAAARAAAGDAARDAARDAAWAAAWAAAGDAARAAARAAAWDAAWDAARDALAPTVTALQADAIRLFGAMINA